MAKYLDNAKKYEVLDVSMMCVSRCGPYPDIASETLDKIGFVSAHPGKPSCYGAVPKPGTTFYVYYDGAPLGPGDCPHSMKHKTENFVMVKAQGGLEEIVADGPASSCFVSSTNHVMFSGHNGYYGINGYERDSVGEHWSFHCKELSKGKNA